jgi:hypothetical protein
MDCINPRLILGIVLLVLGILVLLFEGFLRIGAGIGLIVAGLLIALQNTSTRA